MPLPAAAAEGRPELAFPLLEKGLAVAVENYNQHLRQLEGMQPLADNSSAAAEGASSDEQGAMAARAEEQRVVRGSTCAASQPGLPALSSQAFEIPRPPSCVPAVHSVPCPPASPV